MPNIGFKVTAALLEQRSLELGLSQDALAKTLGCSQATISKIFAGKHEPQPDLRLRITQWLEQTEKEPSVQSSHRWRDEWLARVAAAAARSPAFFDVVEAALRLEESHSVTPSQE